MNRLMNRRTLLRGAGVAIALPWMESVSTLANEAAGGAAPRRMAFVFMGNGVNVDHWGATQTADGLQLANDLGLQSGELGRRDGTGVEMARLGTDVGRRR